MKIMIVDDSKIIRNRIQRAVEEFDLQVVYTAVNGQDAVNMVPTLEPEIITMDLTMPEMDGIEAIENILKIKPDMPILVVSALADKGTAIEAMTKGALGFLCKPFSEQQFKKAKK